MKTAFDDCWTAGAVFSKTEQSQDLTSCASARLPYLGVVALVFLQVIQRPPADAVHRVAKRHDHAAKERRRAP